MGCTTGRRAHCGTPSSALRLYSCERHLLCTLRLATECQVHQHRLDVELVYVALLLPGGVYNCVLYCAAYNLNKYAL